MGNGERRCLVKANSDICKKRALKKLEVQGKNVLFGGMSEDISQTFIKITLII
jgi:hypothetical protein